MPVSLRGVGHRWPNGTGLFHDVDRTFDDGTVTALIGPSGSGKSTLLAILARMTTPTSGRVELPDDAAVLWVFQNPHGVARRTALDHVTLPLLAHGMRRRAAEQRARTILERFGLAPRATARFRELSGGEAQRLMLARGVAAAPTLMLVDEPTAQLDRTTAAEVNGVIAELAAAGTTVVVATHDDATRSACGEVLDLGAFR
ncbi:ABC transporter ATP-binding protein [Curtobacterium sp. MCPF17_047]|uniref:ABC transporter ATP-binding protein n=2 Tax=Curtobacterium TaxID=2034 RepID=UPI000DA95D11|nr:MULTISPECIES: ATP-binding cassette domain-containing protein [unclassified Curtobacterium]PZE54916.1 ABC transporter ATP-binding protein [Curtobacterium sp. MCPF17_001]PZF64165.1 ABC transporter ATP-binding protein [Curtobacterium sp. MCPF17_047]